MKLINLTAPLTLHPSEITEPTRFVVTGKMHDFALTLEGDWKPRENPESEDRRDSMGVVPPITLEGGGSRGMLVYRCDNATFSQIYVTETNETSVELASLRQCVFQEVRMHRCKSSGCIMALSSEGYGINMCDFWRMELMGFDSPCGVSIQSGTVNYARLLNFNTVICHPPCDPMKRQFPFVKDFNPRTRTLFSFGDAQDCLIGMFNGRFHPRDPDDCVGIAADRASSGCVVLTGQILRNRGEKRNWVSGPVQVFPWKKGTEGKV